VGTPDGASVVGTDDGAGVGSGTMTCSLRAPSSASATSCRFRPSGALLDGLCAAAGAARQATATSAAAQRPARRGLRAGAAMSLLSMTGDGRGISCCFSVSGLALDPRGVRRGLPGVGVGAKIASPLDTAKV
jgi:hypothetical protein